jgi:asparagine synthase (glutamine-hydrolysing)
MCGICGTYSYGRDNPADAAVLQSMLQVITHRGPDDQGVYLNGPVGLGMRRLSIIDLAGGKQPIANEDGSVVVVFNGEIYNYRELAAQLRQRGHVLTTASDTEVIVHLYEDFGDSCVDHLRGMFAFAIWDERRQRLLLARDRLGIKPLYYAEAGGQIVFGSEIKAILPHPHVDAALDLEALGNFLSLKYVPAPQTMFAGIAALPPGFTLACDRHGPVTRAYWDVPFTDQPFIARSEDEYAEELTALLRDSVRSHLVSDVPFGAFLSGGIDSSTIVALMSEFLQQPVKTFSVGFAGADAAFSELPYARMVADRYHTDHHEVIVGPQDFIDLAETLVWHLDQPIADDAVLANYMVARLAAQHVKMVLTGEGGDELFAGYARYSGERLSQVFRALPPPARELALAASNRVPGLRRPKIALYALCQVDEAARFANWFPLFNRDMRAELLAEAPQNQLAPDSAEHVFRRQLGYTQATNSLNRMLYLDTKLWLPDDLLARGDKTSMAVSLEARVPLLDHTLVEFAARLPPNLKLRGLTRKYLLRKVSRSWLPSEIIDRKKKGFPFPLSGWFRREARSFVRDLLSPSTIRRRGLFDPRFVQQLLDEHETGAANHGSLLWGLLGVELWQRVFLDRPSIVANGGPPALVSEA